MRAGSLEAGETPVEGALRELREETGFGPNQIAAFFDLDQGEPIPRTFGAGRILTSVVFAVRVAPSSTRSSHMSTDRMLWSRRTRRWVVLSGRPNRESIRRIADKPDRSGTSSLVSS